MKGLSTHLLLITWPKPVTLHEKRIVRREKEPQSFDGKTIDWQDYLVHFEQVAEWNEWNDLERAKQIVMSLRGPAQKILSTLSKQDLGNYNKIKESLNNRFNPREREAAYVCEFEARRHSKDETVSEYGQALRRLGYLAFPNEKQDSEMMEKVLINKFIRGLNNLDLQKHVQFQRANTLDTAISYAIEYEAFINPQNNMRKPMLTSNEVPIQAIKDNKKESTELLTLDQVAKLIDEKLSQLKHVNTETENRNGYYQNRPPRFNNRGRGRTYSVLLSIEQSGKRLKADLEANTSAVKNLERPQTKIESLISDPIKRVQINLVNQNCLFAFCKIDEIDVKFLVDTGSPVSLISFDTFEKLKLSSQLISLDSILTTANGNALSVKGKCILNIAIGPLLVKQEVIVADIKGSSGILGMNFFEQNEIDIQIKSQCLSINGQSIPLFKENSSQCSRIQIARQVSIPANSEMIIEASKRDSFVDGIGIIEPLEWVKSKGLFSGKKPS
ncbi:Hypothetical predicted protein [Mytilus galloprovincialis]|uniref:Retrotransposon gag domain-containing protein n=1 Tax=Mytilus galloprovincialis TaxID=29158 RepID=A0A8B6GLG3_MYTGA|nr:Hypothetical predicted protein [Mytilus galloprovincialis]